MKQIDLEQLMAAINGEHTARNRGEEVFSEQAKEAQRAKLRQHLRERRPTLTERQLCFLLNYFLGLPVILGKHTIVCPEIPILALSSWTKKTQKQAEGWIEQGMRDVGMIPQSRKKLSGRHWSPPQELRIWLPAYGRKTA